MEVQFFLAGIFILFVFTAYQVFFGNKRDSIFTAAGIAIFLSIAALIALVVAAKTFTARQWFFDSWGLGKNIYFFYIPIFFVLIAVLLLHRAKFKYGYDKTLIALVAGMLILWGLFFPVALLTSCFMGDCI